MSIFARLSLHITHNIRCPLKYGGYVNLALIEAELMILPYEIIHRSVVPAIRYMTAISLIEKHGLTQKQAAAKLGVTQAAISNYVRRTRAVAVKIDSNKHIKESVDKLTDLLLDGDVNSPQVTETFTEICEYMRRKRLLCSFHKKMEPCYTIDKCHACDKPPQPSL